MYIIRVYFVEECTHNFECFCVTHTLTNISMNPCSSSSGNEVSTLNRVLSVLYFATIKNLKHKEIAITVCVCVTVIIQKLPAPKEELLSIQCYNNKRAGSKGSQTNRKSEL